MTARTMPVRWFAALVALAILVVLVALPVLAAGPSDTPVTPAAAPAAEKSPNPNKPDKAAKKPKGDPVTVTGTVGTRTDADGRTEYTLTSGSTVLVLDGGPTWFYGDDHPLAGSVGKRVTVVGTQRAGEAEIDVETVDGVALRAPGKPPWAGGWKAVGERHPGWSQEKADRMADKRAEQAARHGVACWPPGLCKDPAAPADD
jgi:hypothetical protein